MTAARTSSISDFIGGHITSDATSTEQLLRSMLNALRRHLGMDVAFLSQFKRGQRIFRQVDSAHPNPPVCAGTSSALEGSYCQMVADGRLPGLIPDAAKHPLTRDLQVTTALPVGAHLSVPIKLSDGRIYGTLCCFSFRPDESLTGRDLGMLRVFADFAAEQIDQEQEAETEAQRVERRIKAVLSDDVLAMVYQPIYDLSRNAIAGFESLARFATIPVRTPDIWFREAARVGLAGALETQAIRSALPAMAHFPESVYISVNASPEMLRDQNLVHALEGWPLERIMLEITEHAAIEHYSDIAALVKPLRKRGLRIAVDDAGAGYASFRHILSLAPDVIKLDRSVTHNIDTDRSRQALANALTGFARATRSSIVAEGIETASELAALRAAGIDKVQGYFLGKPMTLEHATALFP